MTNPIRPPVAALYLRADATLLLVKGDQTIEMHLTPGQCLQLGADFLQVAVQLDPSQLPAAAEVMAMTYIVPSEGQPCAPQQ